MRTANTRRPASVAKGHAALEAAHIRIEELTKALQGLVDLSDSNRSWDLGEVRRSLTYARTVLSEHPQGHPAARNHAYDQAT